MATFRPKANFTIARFIFEAGTKCEAQSLTVATACCLYNKFFEECNSAHYDQYLIAATCLYLAGKAEENHLKIRNVINVCHRILNPEAEPLALGDEYFNLRDSIVQTELLILRVLKFKVNFEHPHKYVLYYFKSISQWLERKENVNVALLKTSISFVHDFAHSNLYQYHKPQHVAVAALYLAMQCYGIHVPNQEFADKEWYQVFCEDLCTEDIQRITEDIMDIYNEETNA